MFQAQETANSQTQSRGGLVGLRSGREAGGLRPAGPGRSWQRAEVLSWRPGEPLESPEVICFGRTPQAAMASALRGTRWRQRVCQKAAAVTL